MSASSSSASTGPAITLVRDDEKTGRQRYRYIRTGPDHFSLALTYDCLAATRDGEVSIGLPDDIDVDAGLWLWRNTL